VLPTISAAQMVDRITPLTQVLASRLDGTILTNRWSGLTGPPQKDTILEFTPRHSDIERIESWHA
jgi:hypothetical protein